MDALRVCSVVDARCDMIAQLLEVPVSANESDDDGIDESTGNAVPGMSRLSRKDVGY